MAVELTTVRKVFVGTGTPVALTPGIYAKTADQIKVYVNDALQSASTYALTGLGDEGGVVVSGTFALGASVAIQRVTAKLQQVETVNNETILEDVLDDALDKSMEIDQELAFDISRAPLVDADEVPAWSWPLAADRANTIAGFDNLGRYISYTASTLAAFLYAAIRVLLGESFKGDPGGNAMAIGLFNTIPTLNIPAGFNRLATTGYDTPTIGAGFVKNVAAGPATAYRLQSLDGRWWEIETEDGAAIKQFGAKGDNAAADQIPANNALVPSNVLALARGTYRFNPETFAPFNYRNTGGATPMYSAVQLTGSNITVKGDGQALIRTAMRAGSLSSEVHFSFLSNQNLVTGGQTDFTFDRVGIDTNNDGLVGNSNQRGHHFVGVQRIRWLAPVFISTGARRGTPLGDIDNSADILVNAFQQHNTTQMGNFRYCNGISIWGGTTRNCPELLDFDSVDQRVTVGGFTYVGPGRSVSGSSQMLDLNSTIDATMGYIAATDVGNLLLVNTKQTTSPDYASYLSYPGWQPNHVYNVGDKVMGSYFAWQAATAGTSGAAAPTDMTITAPVTTVGLVDGANGLTWNKLINPYVIPQSCRLVLGPMVSTKTGPAGANAISLGNEWRTDGGLHHVGSPAVHDLALPYHYHDDTTGMIVWEGERLQLGPGATTNVNAQGGVLAWAWDMQSGVATGPAFEFSNLDAVITDQIFDTVEKGGIRARYVGRMTIRGYKARNMNTTATAGAFSLALANLDLRHCRITVDECEFASGDVQISANPDVGYAAWAANTAYYKGQIRTNGGNFYEATTSGTSAAAGGPAGTGTGIVDNTVVWRYVRRPLEIRWGALNWLREPAAITWGGTAHKYVLGETKNVILPDLPAAATTRRFTVFKAERRCIILRAWLISPDAVAASAGNYRTLLLKTAKIPAGGGAAVEAQVGLTQSFAGTGLTASVERQMMGAATPVAAQELFPGDSLILESGFGGTGMALNGVSLGFEVMAL